MWLPPTARQLVLLAREWLSVRALLFNRFAVVVVVVLASTVAGVAYVEANDGNRIDGRVVDADGDPVANATVVLSVISLRGVPTRETTRTDADGTFAFPDYNERGQATLEFRIWATGPDGAESPKYRHHLDFPRQSRSIVVTLNETTS
jgi:hypothetical protein